MRTPLRLTIDRAPETRTTPDRVEILHALIAAPTFDPTMRNDVIQVARDHPVYGWLCPVPVCERTRGPWREFCHAHQLEWAAVKQEGGDITEFFRTAQPLISRGGRALEGPCLICPHASAYSNDGLCYLHSKNLSKWAARQRKFGLPDGFDDWLTGQLAYPDFGKCRVPTCAHSGAHWIGLCPAHFHRYVLEGKPGGAEKLRDWNRRRPDDPPVKIRYADETAFRRWCTQQEPICRTDGTLNLLGLRPLVRAEIKWALFHHAHGPVEGAHWPLSAVQKLAIECLRQDANSLADLDLDVIANHLGTISRAMLRYLRVVYFTRADTKDIGYIEADHYGVRFSANGSYFDITAVSQRWLRDLLWDWLDLRLTTDPPRTLGPLAATRRACIEFSAYLEAQAPGGGHDPTVLTRDHMVNFVADQRHRAAHGLNPLGVLHRADHPGHKPVDVTQPQVSRVFDGTRRVLRTAMDVGATERIGLDRAFIVALPHGGGTTPGRRRPFSDDVAQALADEANLTALDAMDCEDRGLRDIWEGIIVTGRRAGEMLNLRLECTGRYRNLPILWHDQTKVGNLDEGIRISERLFQRIKTRQDKSVARFKQRHGRPPTQAERRRIALFPRRTTNRTGVKSVSYGWFHTLFSEWVGSLDVEYSVAHQARHTLATNLIKNGANLTHVRRYLGHVSDAMAEHYIHLANTDPKLDRALEAVWVAGPGAAQPGIALSDGEPMSREEAEALAIDLTRQSTPAEGGLCTFQPVVNGDVCPWNMDCHNCREFVMSGADLVYWHRKREQWRMLAERAPDPATADFLHDTFEPTARAIDGLEKALEAVGLLKEALALDLRRPQDYFGRVWATVFRAEELARHSELSAVNDHEELPSP